MLEGGHEGQILVVLAVMRQQMFTFTHVNSYKRGTQKEENCKRVLGSKFLYQKSYEMVSQKKLNGARWVKHCLLN